MNSNMKNPLYFFKKIVSKEFFYALILTILFYGIVKKFNLVFIEPSKEEMNNVEYNFDDDINN